MLNELSTKAYVTVTENVRSAVRSGIRAFAKDERGVTAIEYGLIAVAVAAMIIAVFYNKNGFIHKLEDRFGSLSSAISTATLSVTGASTSSTPA
ncbi:Flp family type IVb pilin [Actinobacillus delphinicola]|uniref:Flp operon protein Flp1 n=1 Tax=Actinobacillus delphinicola TaxID=51161 RepID=A0A448TSR5_9PAST|nr:Flp family type IVb pilin [Actinobacillus delphinicola]VEJ08873.1 flp operon protein Flp1 [Actinobacillus delphinicola]